MKLDILSDTTMTYTGSSFLSGVSLPTVSKSLPGAGSGLFRITQNHNGLHESIGVPAKTNGGFVNARVAKNRKDLHESLERIGQDLTNSTQDGTSTRKNRKDVQNSMLAYTEHARGLQRERHTPKYTANTIKRMFPR